MSRSKLSSNTIPLTLRITKKQRKALDTLPPEISSSALARVLLQLYLDGEIPKAYTLVIAEAQRTESAIRAKQFGSGGEVV